MAILRTCCCWKSVRDGSFACGIYTMVFYTIFVTFGTFHLTPTIDNKVLFVLGLISLCVSGLCVISSALLLVGLCADNRAFLLPWVVCVSISTVLDVFLCFYFMIENNIELLHSILFITDFIIVALNIYCLLCVISQYQEYAAGRGRPEDCLRLEVLHPLPADDVERGRMGTSMTHFLAVPLPSVPAVPNSGSVESVASTQLVVEICQNTASNISTDDINIST